MQRSVRGAGYVTAALLVVIMSMVAGRLYGLSGPVDLPAPKHDQARKALMLDVAAAGDRLVAVGEHGVIVYSNDGGKAWTQAEVPVSTTLTGVTFPTPENGWAVGHSGVVLHSGDGGRSWRKQLDGRRINELEKKRAERALRDARSGGAGQERIARLESDIERAQSSLETGPTRPFLDVWFSQAGTGVAVGGFGLAMRTTDGGRTWQPLGHAIDNPYGWHLNALGSVGGSVFIAGERGHLYRSGDGGRTWKNLPSPYKGTYFGIAAGRDGAVLSFGLEGHVYRSHNGGQSWQRLSVPIQAAVVDAARMPDGSHVLIGASGVIACRSAGASEFRIVRPKGRPLVATVPANGDGVLIVTGPGGAARLDIGSDC